MGEGGIAVSDRSIGTIIRSPVRSQSSGDRLKRSHRNSLGIHYQRICVLALIQFIMLAPMLGGITSHGEDDPAIEHGLGTHDIDQLASKIISGDAFQTVTFPMGSFVIPMDDKQADILKAFGFTHALLRNGADIFRIIQPPDTVIETMMYPSLEVFAGGPILVMPSDAAIVNMARIQFPTVSIDNTISPFTSTTVDVIFEPTDILVIRGTWGHTQDVLTDMGIPFTLVETLDIENDPDMIFDYDLVVDDCPGWGPFISMPIVNNFREFARRGGEIIFTDLALDDMNIAFPGYVTLTTNAEGYWPCNMYRIPEFPGQYFGPPVLDIYTKSGGRVMGNVIDPEVRIMVDSDDYYGEYRILAAYFYYGALGNWTGGIVEGFGYHPGDQPPDARILASILFGNKFVHMPILPDLEITPPDIVFDPPSPVDAGTRVRINATVHNIDLKNATDVVVRFYDGRPGIGPQVGTDQRIPFVPNNGGVGYAEVDWIAAGVGTHQIYVVVDPDDAIIESNEANNVAFNTIEVLDFPPPMLYAESVGDDIVLNWTQNQTSGLSHYLLYRSPSQTGFDFSDVWMNTSADVNPFTGGIDPLNPVWIDANVTRSGSSEYRVEYYYIVRAVNAFGVKSRTSNTVGYYIVNFGNGTNTFSLPLQPIGALPLYDVMTETGAVSLSLLDDNDMWQTYQSDPFIDAQLGKGYVVELDADSRFVFTGEPASMIMYNDGFGFDDVARNQLTASVDASGNVLLYWKPIAGADKYYLLRSDRRDGFFTGGFSAIEVWAPPYQDFGAASIAGELYYLVVPFNYVNNNGSSTYGIGVITEEYNGNEMFGLPLKSDWGDRSADWYVDQIPNCLGIVFVGDGIWKAHFKEFPEGVYDTTIKMGRGYELSVFATSLFTYVGW